MQDRVGEEQDQPHEELRHKVRQQVVDENPRAGLAELARHGDVGLAAQLQHLGADEARQAAPVRRRDAHQQPLEPPAQGEGDQHHQDRVRHAHRKVDPPVDPRVHAPGADRRGDAHQHRDARADERGRNAHRHARGKALERAQQQVPPQRVRAEGVRGRGRLAGLQIAAGDGLLRDEEAERVHAREHRGQQDRQRQDARAAVCKRPHASTSRMRGSTTP